MVSLTPPFALAKIPRVAIVHDLVEENWTSMDFVAEMLLRYMRKDYSNSITVTPLCPPMRRRFTSNHSVGNGDSTKSNELVKFFGDTASTILSNKVSALNADRLINRFWDYPQWLAQRVKDFDLFHVIDHSYAQLVHQLPAERTIVTCHDLDAFRGLLQTGDRRRWTLRNVLAQRVLAGLRKAALVTCVSGAVRDELLAHKLLPPERIVLVPNGIHPSCSVTPSPTADTEAARLLAPLDKSPIDILHVGSSVARKRLDVLLEVFAAVRGKFPQARLIRVGGPFSASQRELVEKLDLSAAIIVLPFLERDVLAAVYRRATLVMQPSEREGFGLPIVEAMACGTPVVASDLPVLREVGGEAAEYCPVAKFDAWDKAISKLLSERDHQPARWAERRAAGLAQAAKYSGEEFARQMFGLYQKLIADNQINSQNRA